MIKGVCKCTNVYIIGIQSNCRRTLTTFDRIIISKKFISRFC